MPAAQVDGHDFFAIHEAAGEMIERARDLCRFRRTAFELTEEVLDRAWSGYFGGRRQS